MVISSFSETRGLTGFVRGFRLAPGGGERWVSSGKVQRSSNGVLFL